MDADKDKPLPENPPTIVALADNTKIKDDNEDISSKEKENEKPDIIVVDQDSPKKHEPHTPSTRASEADDSTVKPSENKELEKEKQQPANDDDDDDDVDQTNPKEEESHPQRLDLEKLSEEIDRYILTLSTPTKVDPDNDTNSKSTSLSSPTKADPNNDTNSKSTPLSSPTKADPDNDTNSKSTPLSSPTKADPDNDINSKSTPTKADPDSDTNSESTPLSTPKKADPDNDTNSESTSSPPVVPHFVEQFVALVEAKIGDYDSTENPVKWVRLTEEDSKSFLEYINRLSSLSDALSQFSSDKKYADSLNHVGRVLQRAMSYVEEEFKSLLEDYKINDDPKPPKQSPSPTSNQEPEQNPPPSESPAAPPVEENNFFPGYSDQIISDLIRLSKALIAGGHETECCQLYFVARRNALEDSLNKLGFEKYSIDEVQKLHWESLEREIVSWIATLKQCFSVHIPSEKKISQSVFSNHLSISESLYCSLSQGIIIQLLNFAGAVALTKRAAEKLFKFLDMYEVLRDTLPTIDDLFPEDLANDIKTDASRIKGRLGEAMISIFTELENSIGSDSAKTPVPGGAVHPLTRYTMNYLKLACEYKDTLEQVFREHQKIERADSATGSDFNYNNSQPQTTQVKQSPFQAQMTKAMDLLDSNLELKGKMYKDNALSSIFMMNNGRYILQKVKGSNEIISLMGDSWCRNRSSNLRNYHRVYQRETWGRLLHCLHPDGLTVHGKIVKPVLKERFKSFNAMFDEIHKAQSNWVVSDEQLQSELRVSISNMVIPAYRSFLGRFSQVFTPGRQTEKYVKYQAEEIETLIDELFDGNAAPVGRKRT
ncbi:hypothetical protein CASFOL_019009 [Castilleja foliolosa]|uniref:Exocyst subunit Exo70 family protein n=1 Tax=Castilleja foliolosa TaxID=1961234 RepID=A0ABD3D361_9LAMI